MSFNTPQLSPPPFADPWVDPDGVPTRDITDWFLTVLLPSIAQSPSVSNATTPPFAQSASAAIGLTALPVGSLSSALYRVSVFARVTTPDGVSSSVAPQISFINDGVTCAITGAALTTDAIDQPGTWTFFVEVDAPGPISIGTTYASNTPNAMSYDITATVERVN